MIHNAAKISGPREKLPQLDVLRGLCAIMVALNHVEIETPLQAFGVIRHGALFVDFFFVLSGFIIAYNYAGLSTLPELSRFMGLRLARVYPLHLVMLFVFLGYELLQWFVVALGHVSLDSAPFSYNNTLAFLLNLTMLNGVGLSRLSFNVPAWSISTEFWTYLLFGLIAVTCAGRPKLLGLAAFIVAAGALAMLLGADGQPSLTHDWRVFFPRCVFSFFLGVCLYAAMHTRVHGTRRQRSVIDRANIIGVLWQVATVCAGLWVVTRAEPSAPEWEFAAPFVFVAVIAVFVLYPDTALVRLTKRRPMLWIGSVSYSIYMVHMIVLLAIEAFLRYVLHAPKTAEGIEIAPGVGAGLMVFYLAGVLWIAALTYRFVEAPGRQFGRELLSRGRVVTRVQTVP
jgi:peptidoglycan/LPS O-acetylase OafA/YrhL